MPESPLPSAPSKSEAPKTPEKAPEAPKRLCEKCRSSYPLDQFAHGVEGQDCVCRRCLKVMGYKVQGNQVQGNQVQE